MLLCTRLFARDEDGELAPLLLEWWYSPSAEVSEPDTGGESGPYILSGLGGVGVPEANGREP